MLGVELHARHAERSNLYNASVSSITRGQRYRRSTSARADAAFRSRAWSDFDRASQIAAAQPTGLLRSTATPIGERTTSARPLCLDAIPPPPHAAASIATSPKPSDS